MVTVVGGASSGGASVCLGLGWEEGCVFAWGGGSCGVGQWVWGGQF